ncbi:hypothetical protein PBI_CANTARE_62 [Brevibacterium phage Cantare]|uniref:Rho termination factor N-terminal domain-containing protein n=1 Tax=Brevibacterium phage Cantare TaxID=2338395 RepID=A0A3G3LYQ9_9CAUD|nr:hypothetical protein PQD70_gp062 [Brevibacterium phage Cantare]AYQ99282.1 hypothetical protein PBI_CANTARE_62 [Brevibacterium phage Cantare]
MANNKPELTAVETLMQEIGLALLKFTNYELGDVKVTAEAETVIEVETEDEPKPKATKARGRKPKAEPVEEVVEEDDEDEDGEEGDELTKADLEKKTERQLRSIAVNMGFDKEDVKGADKETLINSILSDDDEDDDEDEDGEDDSDSVDVDALVAKLEGMTLVAVKKVAREEYGFKAPDYKGMDKDAVIELIVEKVSDSDVEDDDDDEEAPYTEEELDSMSMAELKSICKEWGIKIKIGEKKQAHIDAILDAQEED